MSDTKPDTAANTELDAGRLATSDTVVHDSQAPMRKSDPSGRGLQIGRFIVLSTLGAGGMGTVYSAYDPQLDRKVAIKLLTGDVVIADGQTRLLREAQAMAKIRHPNVIAVHDAGTFHDQVYVAMEYADAGTLRAWLERQPRAPDEILAMYIQAGRGLAAAHEAGLVHRDFKPDNVLCSRDGRVQVTDFGLVGVMTEADAPATQRRRATSVPEGAVDSGPTPLTADLTQTGAIMGTPRYMAPEQFHGTTATARADQFSFCVALYEALYGERPFAGETYAALSVNVTSGAILPAPKSAHVPPWLREVLLRGLAVDPTKRFESMDALLASLARTPRRTGAMLAIGGLAVAVVAAGVGFALHATHDSPCAGGADHVAATWNPQKRDAMHAAFTATARPLAAIIFDKSAALVDGWTQSWERGFVGACEATRVRGEQSEHLLDLRMQCLDRRLAEVRAMIVASSDGGAAAVDHALETFGALPPLAPCADPTSLLAEVPPPDDTLARVRVAQVRGQLDAQRSAERLGDYKRELALAHEALDAANTTHYPPVVAEAERGLGDAQAANGDVAHAIPTLHDAMYAAARAGDSTALVAAASSLLHAINQEGRRQDNADEIAGVAEAIAEHAHPAIDVYLRLQEQIAQHELARSRLDAAEARLQNVLALAKSQLGPDDRTTILAIDQLGDLYLQRGKLAEAEKAFGQVLAANEAFSGKDHPMVADTLKDLANVQRRMGKLAAAKASLDRALAIDRAALPADHPLTGHLHMSLAKLAGENGDAKTALAEFEQAHAIFVKAYGEDSETASDALAMIGSELSELKRYDEARPALVKAIELSDKRAGADNHYELDLYNNLALLDFNQQKYDDALARFQRARAIAVAYGGPENSDIVDIDTNIANIYERRGEYAKGIALQQQTIALASKTLAPDHPRVAMLLVNLGINEDKQKHYAESFDAYQRALPIFVAKFGENHMYTLQAVVQSAEELVELKRFAEALPLFERAVAIGEKAGAPPPLLAQIRAERDETRGKVKR